MRDPANFVIVDGDAVTMYCGAHDATRLGPILLAGHDAVVGWVRGQEQTEGFDPWCEAVVLIDVRARVLGVHGRLDMSHLEGVLTPDSRTLHYAYRAAYLTLLTRAWPGWQLRWAYEGMDDIARYLGTRYRSVGYGPSPQPSLTWAVDRAPDYFDAESDEAEDALLITVATDPSAPVQAWHLYNLTNSAFELGAAVTTALAPERRITEVPFVPTSGLHVDVSSRVATVWTIRDVAGLHARWPQLWPGWRLELAADRYTTQLRLCRDEVFVLEPDMASAWEHLTLWEPVRVLLSAPSPHQIPSWPPILAWTTRTCDVLR